LLPYLEVRERHPHIHFTVIGEGPEPEDKKIKDLAAALKIDDVVQFREFVPHDELPSVLKRSDIYVDTLPVSAGVSVGLLEAMASGCFPVVARIPGVSEVITDGKNGLIYEGKNSDQLAEKICLAIENSESKEECQKNQHAN
jgi:glycosyltransferase involved in cell wall biosynthesis